MPVSGAANAGLVEHPNWRSTYRVCVCVCGGTVDTRVASMPGSSPTHENQPPLRLGGSPDPFPHKKEGKKGKFGKSRDEADDWFHLIALYLAALDTSFGKMGAAVESLTSVRLKRGKRGWG